MTAKQVKEVITKLGGEYDQALANENWGLMTQLQGKVQHVYWRVGGLVSLGNVMNRVQIGSYEVFYQEKQAELRRLQKESQEIGTSVQKRHEVSQAIGELKSLIEKTLQEKNLRRNKSIEAMVCYREIPRLKRLCQDECGDQRTVDRKKFTQVIVEMPEGVLLSEYGYKLDNPFLKLQKLQREVNEAFAALLGKTIA